jgi:hypothetical protein
MNREEMPGFSVTKVVSALNEWCAEAYMETDYSNLNEKDFEKNIREYVAFLASNNLN